MFTNRNRSALIAGLIALTVSATPATQAEAATSTLGPVDGTKRASFFEMNEIDSETIKRVKFQAHSNNRRISRAVETSRVRKAAAAGETLRVNHSAKAKRGRLEIVVTNDPTEPPPADETPVDEPPVEETPVEETPVEEPPVEDPGCVASLLELPLESCDVIFSDTGKTSDAASVWGTVGCQDDSRHQLVSSGGDTAPTAAGLPQANSSFRRLTVLDGDDYYGERCEIGRNDHRYGTGGGDGTAMLYREGQRRLTHMSLRLPNDFPLETKTWQVVMQMKQTQPSANGGGTPILSLEARDGKWRLMQSTSSGPSSLTQELWSAPAERGVWTRFAFDVTYSQDPNLGSVQVSADLDGDGDSSSAAEQSPAFKTYTLKRETEGGLATDGIAPGESIPAHLRIGPYHNPSIDSPNGVTVDVDNVQVTRLP